jgi:hypothetical protein
MGPAATVMNGHWLPWWRLPASGSVEYHGGQANGGVRVEDIKTGYPSSVKKKKTRLNQTITYLNSECELRIFVIRADP